MFSEAARRMPTRSYKPDQLFNHWLHCGISTPLSLTGAALIQYKYEDQTLFIFVSRVVDASRVDTCYKDVDWRPPGKAVKRQGRLAKAFSGVV